MPKKHQGLKRIANTVAKGITTPPVPGLGVTYGWASTQQKVDRAVRIINQIKAYEDEGLTAKAEAEIKKLIPWIYEKNCVSDRSTPKTL